MQRAYQVLLTNRGLIGRLDVRGVRELLNQHAQRPCGALQEAEVDLKVRSHFPGTLDRPITDASEYSVRPATPPPLRESHPPRPASRHCPQGCAVGGLDQVTGPVQGPLPPGGGHVQGTGNAAPDPGDLGASGPGLDRLRAVACGRVPAVAGRPAARPWLPARTAYPVADPASPPPGPVGRQRLGVGQLTRAGPSHRQAGQKAAVRLVSWPAMWLFDAFPMPELGNSPAICAISLT